MGGSLSAVLKVSALAFTQTLQACKSCRDGCEVCPRQVYDVTITNITVSQVRQGTTKRLTGQAR